jgi:antirestriction protein
MNPELRTRTDGETTHSAQPRIYVASLSDYNNGRLHGQWLDADQEVSALEQAVQAMLAASPDAGAEEYAIHDYDGFYGLRLSEHESLRTVSQLARNLRVHGEAFAAWVAIVGIDYSDRLAFSAHYLGRYRDLNAFGREIAADLGLDQYVAAVPKNLQPYVHIDSDSLARDMALGGEIATSEGREGLHVFLAPGTA